MTCGVKFKLTQTDNYFGHRASSSRLVAIPLADLNKIFVGFCGTKHH
jgi:hypothetical protein